jgi:hypothetical protein
MLFNEGLHLRQLSRALVRPDPRLRTRISKLRLLEPGHHPLVPIWKLLVVVDHRDQHAVVWRWLDCPEFPSASNAST